MKLNGWTVFRFALPLRRPIAARRKQVSVREGLLVRLETWDGHHAWGEVAPLPGVHRETPDSVLPYLKLALSRLCAAPLPRGLPQLEAELHRLWAELDLPAVIRYGLEMALLALLARANGSTPARLFVPEPLESLPLNGVLFGQGDDVLSRAAELVAGGYPALKLKVGRARLEAEIELVLRLREAIGPAVALRLDANRAWTLPQALQFARAVESADLEYIEEPLQEPAHLPRLIAQTSLPVALDETLGDGSPELLHATPCRAWILKPSVLGGFFSTRRWVQRAAGHGALAVVSAAFDTGLGLAALGQFAAAHMQPGVAAGLATHEFLAEDLLASPYPVQRGRLQIDRLDWMGRSLRVEALEPLAAS